MRKNSIKHSRINVEIRKSLSKVIAEEVHDPRVGMMTSVTDVEVATDLKTCKVYISVLGQCDEKEFLKGLKSAAGYIRRELSSSLKLRYTPELVFEMDHSIEYGSHINTIIAGLNKGDENE